MPNVVHRTLIEALKASPERGRQYHAKAKGSGCLWVNALSPQDALAKVACHLGVEVERVTDRDRADELQKSLLSGKKEENGEVVNDKENTVSA